MIKNKYDKDEIVSIFNKRQEEISYIINKYKNAYIEQELIINNKFKIEKTTKNNKAERYYLYLNISSKRINKKANVKIILFEIKPINNKYSIRFYKNILDSVLNFYFNNFYSYNIREALFLLTKHKYLSTNNKMDFSLLIWGVAFVFALILSIISYIVWLNRFPNI